MTTLTYPYTLQVMSRVSASRNAEKGNHVRVHEIIPGSVVRGAMAARWWQHAGGSGAASSFNGLFDRQLSVGQAVPVGALLVSASAQVCKYETTPACKTVIIDRALLEVTARGANQAPRRHRVCWECGGPLGNKSGAGWRTDGLHISRSTKAALGELETATDGELFSREALDAFRIGDGLAPLPLLMCGTLRVTGDVDLGWLQEATLRLGGKRSLGLGEAKMTLGAPVEAGTAALPTPAGARTVLRATSPTIILDDYGAATVEAHDLAAELGRRSGDPIAVEAPGWIRSDSVTGWHMQSALPKPTDWAIAPGSTIILSGLTPEGWCRLAGGVGVRTSEGYGRLELLDPDDQHLRQLAGVAAAATFKKGVPASRWPAMLAEARSATERILGRHRSGQSLDPTAALNGREAQQLLGVGRNSYRALLELSEFDLEDALEALR